MSLAPTLKTTLATAIGVGAAAIVGLAPTILTDRIEPSTATVSVSGQAPTVVSSQGPTAYPDQGQVSILGLVPDLKRERIIYPLLPDAVGEENDLTPTLVENVINPTSPITPAVVTVSNLAPSVIGNGQQSIAVTNGLATLSGLAPDVILPEGQIIDRFPGKASLEVIPLEPTLSLEITGSPDQASFTISGLAPGLVPRYGWQTVELTGSAVWTDVQSV